MFLLSILSHCLKKLYIVLITRCNIKPYLFIYILYDICVDDSYLFCLVYIFICFIPCFFNIYLFFKLFILVIVTSYCILYLIYIYILVRTKLNYVYILSHILHWIVIILKQNHKRKLVCTTKNILS